ncbi:MAG TPA: diaminopimelate epimerase [Hyphomicrobiaceae bacterium]|nr:diaminopimelate epimerase [Hyphomicrobiaceae bacterium]
MSTSIPFQKMNGLGNEILVVDLRGRAETLDAAAVRAIGHGTASHFDQMMVLRDPRTAETDAYVQIYNIDGSEAGACGNGMRCVSWVVAEGSGRKALRFETHAGVLEAHVTDAARISVDMGRPRCSWQDIPLARPFQDSKAIALTIDTGDGRQLSAPSVVNVGNPHAVFWVDDPYAYDLARLGPPLETHPLFPERANISLARVTTPRSIVVRTWERGAGLTRACGSAACATAVCAARKGLAERHVTVTVPGGALQIEWRDDDRIWMTGPVQFEHAGQLEAGRVA